MFTKSLVNRRTINTNIALFYAIIILQQSFSLSLSALVPLLNKNGMSYGGIFYLQAGYVLVISALQTPTGYFADIVGRKKSILIGAIASSIGVFGYVVAESISAFLIAEFILALGTAFISGADTALLFESLAENKKEEKYGQTFGRALASAQIISLIMIAFGGYLSSFGERVPFIATLICEVLMIFVALLLIEPKQIKVEKQAHIKEVKADYKFALFENKKIANLIYLQALILSSTLIAFWFLVPIFNYFRVETTSHGYLFAILGSISALTSANALRVEKIFRNKTRLFILIATSFGLIGAGAGIKSLTIFALFIQQISLGTARVYFDKHITILTPNHKRATIKSIGSTVLHFCQFLLIILSGILLDYFGTLLSLTISGMLIFMIGIILVKLKNT